MNVWFVNHYALPPTGSGPNRHHALARGLGKLGHDVTVFASGFEHYARVQRMAAGGAMDTEMVDGVRYVWLRTPAYKGSLGRIGSMVAFAARFVLSSGRAPVPAPDVVVGSSPHLLTPLGAWLVARRRRVPFVLEVRDLWPRSLVDLLGMSPRHPAVLALGLLERLLYRRADRVVTLLPGAVDHIIEHGAAAGRVRWIPNGVDLSTVPPPLAPPPEPPFVVMYAGTLGLVNGLDMVLDAGALLLSEGIGPDEVRIRLVGPGPAWGRLAARVAAERLVNVTVEAAVPKNAVHDLLAEAHAFLMVLQDSPLFRLGVSPNKLFDYFAAARPVLFVVDTPYNPVADAGAGLSLPPGDPARLAAAIKELRAISPGERAEMGRCGADFVRRRHDYEQLAGEMEGLLLETAAASSRR